jgi:hypothetical protein
MEPETRPQLVGGAVCVVAGIVVLVIGAPGLLGLLLLLVGVAVLGALLAGYSSVPELVRDRTARRRPRRPGR